MERDFLTFVWFFLSCVSGFCLGMMYNDWRNLSRGAKILYTGAEVLILAGTGVIAAILCYAGLKAQFIGTNTAIIAVAFAGFAPIGLGLTVMLVTICFAQKCHS